jgi:predicted RNase H-like HicB family nuclease
MTIETELEDERWLAEVLEIKGVMCYGATKAEAISRAEALALRVLADKIDHGEDVELLKHLFVTPA